MTRRFMASALTVAALAGAASIALGWTSFQSTPSPEIGTSRVYAVSVPQGATTQDLANLGSNLIFGTSLPTSAVATAAEGTVSAKLSGFVLQSTGEHQVLVTVIDESDDVDFATLYLDGTAVFVANRANGGVIDRNGKAIATLSTLILPQEDLELKVTWVANDGTVRSCTGGQL